MAGLFARDASKPAEEEILGRFLLAAIDVYQEVSPPLRSSRCRLEPSCSRYAEAVIADHGAWSGALLTLRRLLRCGPWTPLGTSDEPPPAAAEPAH